MREQLPSIVWSSSSEDAVDGMKQFAGDRDQRLQFAFMSREQGLVKGFHVWVPTHRRQSRHIKGAAQVATAGATNARRLMHRSTRVLMYRIEPASRHPLTHFHVRGQQDQLAQDLQRADGRDAGGAC